MQAEAASEAEPRRPDARAAGLPGRPRRCGCRRWRAATRASCWRSAIPPSAATATPIPSSARSAWARWRSRSSRRSSASPIEIGDITVTECQMVNQFAGSKTEPPQFTRGYGLVFGHGERKAMAMALVDRALRAEELGEDADAPAQSQEFVLYHCDNVEATGFVEHLKLPHYVDFQSRAGEGPPAARRRRASRDAARMTDRHGLQLRLPRREHQADDPPRPPEGGGDPRPPGALRQPRDAAALWLGHRRHPGDGRRHRPGRHAEGHRPGRRRHHQRRLHPPLLRPRRRRRDDRAAPTRPASSRPATASRRRRCARARSWSTRCRCRSRCSGWSRAWPRPEAHARAGRLRPDACEAVRGHRPARPYRDRLQLSGHGRTAAT